MLFNVTFSFYNHFCECVVCDFILTLYFGNVLFLNLLLSPFVSLFAVFKSLRLMPFKYWFSCFILISKFITCSNLLTGKLLSVSFGFNGYNRLLCKNENRRLRLFCLNCDRCPICKFYLCSTYYDTWQN